MTKKHTSQVHPLDALKSTKFANAKTAFFCALMSLPNKHSSTSNQSLHNIEQKEYKLASSGMSI